MVDTDTLFLPGLIAPETPSGLAPLPGGLAWWTLRAAVQRAVRAAALCLHTPPDAGIFFGFGAQEALDRLALAAEALDAEWTLLYRQLAEAAPPVATVRLEADQSAYVFTWERVGPSFVSLRASTWHAGTTTRPANAIAGRAVSLAFESAAVKYLRVVVEVYRSALQMSFSDPTVAARYIAEAVCMARDCVQQTLPLHSVSPAVADQLARTTLLLSPHFWRRWLAGLLVAHAKQCERFGGATRPATLLAAAFDSGQLCDATVGADAMPELCSTEHAAEIASVGRARKAEVLVRVALVLAADARAQNEINNMTVASRLLHWYGVDEQRAAAAMEAACLDAVLAATTGQTTDAIWGAERPPVATLEFAASPRAALADGLLRVPLALYE
jgi:hypothetical protein